MRKYDKYSTRTFQQVYESAEEFLSDYNLTDDTGHRMFPETISQDNARLLYYLLYSKYGNSAVASSDENRFRIRLFSLVFQYGPSWEKELEVQEKLRGMSEEELLIGGKQIFNNAMHPADSPSTNTAEELPYINNQNVSKSKKGVLDAYALLLGLLKTDVTENFLQRFHVLFAYMPPHKPTLFVVENFDYEVDDNDNND